MFLFHATDWVLREFDFVLLVGLLKEKDNYKILYFREGIYEIEHSQSKTKYFRFISLNCSGCEIFFFNKISLPIKKYTRNDEIIDAMSRRSFEIFFVLILFKDYDDLKFLKWNHYKKIIKKLYGKFFFFKFIIFLMKPLER